VGLAGPGKTDSATKMLVRGPQANTAQRPSMTKITPTPPSLDQPALREAKTKKAECWA
jgi:hypothetical protein